MIRRPPRSTLDRSSAASDVYKRQLYYTHVDALAIDPDGSVYAGGDFATAGGVAVHRIARWDGTVWHALDSGLAGMRTPIVSALALDPAGALYAGGEFITAGGLPSVDIARWDPPTVRRYLPWVPQQ